MGSMPLRAALGCFSSQGSMAVTALTELAYRKLGTARDQASIDSANAYVRSRHAPDVPSLFNVPTTVGSLTNAKNVGVNSKPPTSGDIHAIRLAAFSVVAKMRSMSTMQLIGKAGDNLVQRVQLMTQPRRMRRSARCRLTILTPLTITPQKSLHT
ncbi:hypothetical protein ACI48D_20100 [Massilia sp. LXY-6]